MPILRAVRQSLLGTRGAEAGAAGVSRANPAPLNTETVAGPWKLTVTQVQTGTDAATAVTNASQFNVAPADGTAYVTVKVKATNAADRDFDIEPDDFGVTGSSGLVYRFSQQTPPDPILNTTVKAGDSVEGWVVAEVPSDEQNLLLIYDSVSISGSWSDCVFALSAGAAIADLANPVHAPNDLGKSIASAIQTGDELVTADWAIKLIEVVTGQDVANLFPSSDYRTTALLPGDDANLPFWLALHVGVKNVRAGGLPAFLPPTAFLLATSDGKTVNDVTLLTPPDPDTSGTYYPGASRDGWVLFEQPTTYPDNFVRFLPFESDADSRYLNFGGGANPSSQPTAPAATVAAGSKVTVSQDTVNLRSEASTSGAVVTELKQGDTLTVTGPAVTGGDYQWYPVTDDATGDSGYVATNFVTPAS